MQDGFLRVAAATSIHPVADCRHNADAILAIVREAAAAASGSSCFPSFA
jgi:NAD+ synthase (glutamine-hydrolysing)